jgi:superfamily I DNA/RNA helicase
MAGARGFAKHLELDLTNLPDDGRGNMVITPNTETRFWSSYQEAIFEWFAHGKGHLVVDAVAGSGKTTTIIEGINHAWEDDVLLTAFTKDIAEVLNQRLAGKPGAQAKTLHGVGMRYIGRQYRGIPINNKDRARWLVDQVGGRKLPFQVMREVANLHTKAREVSPLEMSQEIMLAIMEKYGFGLDDNWGPSDDELAALAIKAYRFAADNPPDRRVGVDFADMIFLPLQQGLLTPDYPLIVVDETQDMNKGQLEMVVRISDGRICIVGDPYQSIYLFRGAETGGMTQMKDRLQAQKLPLSVTYRCGHAIVAEAQKLVPHIEAGEKNPEGTIILDPGGNYLFDNVTAGDFILSRINAPLVKLCLQLLAAGKRARIKGRDISKQILKILKRIKADKSWSLAYLEEKVREYEVEHTTRLASNGDPEGADRVRDNCAVLFFIAEDSRDMSQFYDKCSYLFVKDVDVSEYIMLSSVHKAKGLEADTVYVLADTLYRFGYSEEERNIHYVAITRAKYTLYLVDGLGLTPKQKEAKAKRLEQEAAGI